MRLSGVPVLLSLALVCVEEGEVEKEGDLLLRTVVIHDCFAQHKHNMYLTRNINVTPPVKPSKNQGKLLCVQEGFTKASTKREISY